MDYQDKDRMQLLQIFSAEVWILILEKVKDSVDLENATNASIYLRNHYLFSKRVLFLIPNVLKVLDHRFRHPESSLDAVSNAICAMEVDAKSYKQCYSCPRWTTEWWCKATSKLRLVCETWCNALDKYVQGLPLLDDEVNESNKYYICQSRATNVMFFTDRRQEKFLKHFKTSYLLGTNWNQFVGRKVDFYMWEDPNREHIPDNWSRFLLEHGQHILYSDIFIRTRKYESCYREMLELLKLLPNLKVLSIDTCVCWDWKNKRELGAYIESHPLPRLDNLQVLSTRTISSLIFKALIQKYGQVPVLRVRAYYPVEATIYTAPFSNLKHLIVQLHRITDLKTLEKHLTRWPRLHHHLRFGRDFLERSNIPTLLREKWGGALSSLEIKVPRATKFKHGQWFIIGGFRSLKLTIPGLTKSNVIMPLPITFDFILPFKFLHATFLYYRNLYCYNEKQIRLMKCALESEEVYRLPKSCDSLITTYMWKTFFKLKHIIVLETNLRLDYQEYYNKTLL